MANNLKSTYDASNFVLTQDYSHKFNQIDVGKPEARVEYDPDTQTTSVELVSWKRGMVQETAGFKYVGMDYATAKSCANHLRSVLTLNVYEWAFGWHEENGNKVYGWYKNYATPTLESEVSLQQRNGGCMYDVVVNAKFTSLQYSSTPDATDINSKPLHDVLVNLAGWSSAVPLSGVHFNAASADNISLIVAPTKNVTFELVGQKIFTTDTQAESGYSIDDWYRATTDWYAQVKYEGMTKAACRTLFSSLNSTNGWYMSYHPWVYGKTYDAVEGKWVLGWSEDATTTLYQCLNDFKAIEDESGMFTCELTLHAQRIEMTTSPSSYTAPSYPSFWSTKIPGMGNFL